MNVNNFYDSILAPSKTRTAQDDEFDGPALDPKWSKSNSAAVESYDYKIRSALFMQFAASSSLVQLTQAYVNAGNFSITFCFSLRTHLCGFRIVDTTGDYYVGVEAMHGTPGFRTIKNVAAVFSQVDLVTGITLAQYQTTLLHIQRSTNNWELYYSNNGVIWTKFATTISLTFTVARINIFTGVNGAATPTATALHWIRRDWITI